MIELTHKEWTATLAPEAGGSVLSLKFRGADILRPAPAVEAVMSDPREAACYPCVPWFGRIVGGLDFEGRHFSLAPTLPACDPEHALHGEGWINAWETTSAMDNSAECQFDYTPKVDAFPFPFRTKQRFRLNEDGFTLSLSVTNTGTQNMPAGLGLHPFFPRKTDTMVKLKGARWSPTSPVDFSQSAGFGGDALDHSLSGWDGIAEIKQANAAIYFSATTSMAHLYAPVGADFFCIEPITHLPLGFGRQVLSPGDALSVSLAISAKPAIC